MTFPEINGDYIQVVDGDWHISSAAELMGYWKLHGVDLVAQWVSDTHVRIFVHADMCLYFV